jgi:lysozyme family protein
LVLDVFYWVFLQGGSGDNMANPDIAIALVLKHEGGLSEDPADPGGLTNFGISQRAYPHLDIKALTKEEAAAIYRQDYWTPKMAALDDQRLANCVLDCAVNQGPEVARSFLSITQHLPSFQQMRIIRYFDATFRKTELRQFLNGWIKRTLDVE